MSSWAGIEPMSLCIVANRATNVPLHIHYTFEDSIFEYSVIECSIFEYNVPYFKLGYFLMWKQLTISLPLTHHQQYFESPIQLDSQDSCFCFAVFMRVSIGDFLYRAVTILRVSKCSSFFFFFLYKNIVYLDDAFFCALDASVFDISKH